MSSYAGLAAARAGLSPNDVQEGKQFARDQVAEFRESLVDGSTSLRLLALLGGLAMVVLTLLGILGDLISFKWLVLLIQVYCLLLGALIVVLETSRNLSCFRRLETSLYKNALFLKYIWGRGLLYFFAGTLMMSLREFLDVVVGLYMCGVSIIFMMVGHSAQSKLTEFRKGSIPPARIQEEFARADTSGSGSLDLHQFRGLIAALGMDLTKRETEAAFGTFGEQRISYEQFLSWWNQEASDDDFQFV